MALIEPKDKRITQLEQDLAKLMLKVEELQNDTKIKHEDIESLRYEIAWKSTRKNVLNFFFESIDYRIRRFIFNDVINFIFVTVSDRRIAQLEQQLYRQGGGDSAESA